ncbi:MAG: RNA methyltransferase [Coriobacteriales bacterium]|nr:RNA methyltransferase [Coriobacteriales bacterium]
MSILRITSTSDENLNVYTNLTNHELRNKLDPERGVVIVESETAIRVALERGVQPLSFLLDERKLQAMSDVLEQLPPQIPIYVLPPEEVEQLCGYNVTRGALCAMRRPPMPSLRELVAGKQRVVVLEGLTDTSNVGAAFRNAAALGADAVIVAPSCADPLARRAVRVSMGNVFCVPWMRAEKPWPGELFSVLHDEGYCCVALALEEGAVSLGDKSLAQVDAPLALFFGSEGQGLSRKVIRSCDRTVIIPMSAGVDSLNVAATTGIVLWELRRRG